MSTARTDWPLASRSLTRWPPMNPPAPVTRVTSVTAPSIGAGPASVMWLAVGASFVTGASGFVGRHLTAALNDGPIVAPSRHDLDLLDGEAVVRAVAEAAPATVFHLAAQAHVG